MLDKYGSDICHCPVEKWPKLLDFALWVGYINGKEKPGEGLAVKQRSSRMPKSEFMKIGCFFAAVSVCIALIACGDSSDYGANSNTNAASQTKTSQTVTESNRSSASTKGCMALSERTVNLNEKDAFTDSRDGRTYKKVKIGSQTWMAENLNYETDGSFCYGDEPICCGVYGRLYTWAAAMDSAGLWSESGKGCGSTMACHTERTGAMCPDGDKIVPCPVRTVRGVCPEGWHLPRKTEWETLLNVAGGNSTAGNVLKSTFGWNKSGNGTDSLGFSALPAGVWNLLGNFSSEGDYAHFWSSTDYRPSPTDVNYANRVLQNNNIYAYAMFMQNYNGHAWLYESSRKEEGFSVRCIQDSTSEEKSSSSESLKSSSSQIIESLSSNRSSSSSARLSSGMAQSSSSTNAGFVGGTLVDSRDGQTYKTVVIGSQTWMAENLNFKTDSSFCNNNSADNCEKYGRLYIWGNAKSACPSGWHLPSNEEWDTLFTAVSGQFTAGTKLKFASGWKEYKGKNGNGTDAFGFSALPAGHRDDDGAFFDEGYSANFWSSTDVNSGDAYCMRLYYNGDHAYLGYYNKDNGFSVRCLQDDALEAKSSSSSSNRSSSSSAGSSSGGVPGWSFG